MFFFLIIIHEPKCFHKYYYKRNYINLKEKHFNPERHSQIKMKLNAFVNLTAKVC